MTDKQRQAILDLEKELRSLAKGATGLADMVSGQVAAINVIDPPDHPASPSRFADLVALDVRVRTARVDRALAKFRAAFAPGELRLVDPESEAG